MRARREGALSRFVVRFFHYICVGRARYSNASSFTLVSSSSSPRSTWRFSLLRVAAAVGCVHRSDAPSRTDLLRSARRGSERERDPWGRLGVGSERPAAPPRLAAGDRVAAVGLPGRQARAFQRRARYYMEMSPSAHRPRRDVVGRAQVQADGAVPQPARRQGHVWGGPPSRALLEGGGGEEGREGGGEEGGEGRRRSNGLDLDAARFGFSKHRT